MTPTPNAEPARTAASAASARTGAAGKGTAARLGRSRKKVRRLSSLSPFELKNALLDLASESTRPASEQLLNAGRGNPNWNALGPREAFLALGHFALAESRQVWTMDDLGGMPEKSDARLRFERFCEANPGLTGMRMLRACVEFGIDRLGFDPDAWVHELVDGYLGDNYPVPERVLHHCERVIRAFLADELYRDGVDADTVDVFPTEGGTAAMCYLFDTLVTNRILERGDTVAIMTPIFTPYLEIPELDRYAFEVVRVKADMMTEEGVHMWRYPNEEVDKLADPKVKALMLVNPSNPPSMAMSDRVRDRIAGIVRTSNPGLVVITDDVYSTFVPGFRSLAEVCPRNTALVYSFSKHFGCTGWRLGVIALPRDNVFDEKIAALPAADRKALRKRYATLTLEPEKLRFVDRLVADSRQVALNHTAGLSTPQQTQMTLFALFDLLEEGRRYKQLLRDIVHRRLGLLMEGAGGHISDDPGRAAYYVELDILAEARAFDSPEFAAYLEATYEPTDILFRLAHQSSIVLLNGGGFDGPEWSVRVSLANLDDLDYLKIGHHLHAILEEYRRDYAHHQQPPAKP